MDWLTQLGFDLTILALPWSVPVVAFLVFLAILRAILD